MRVVRSADELPDAMASAAREAEAAFGDPTLYAERYLEGARHVEVQAFGDGQGGALHLGLRDCSLQRRHQKVIEEAPAPGVPEAEAAALGEMACALLRSVGLRGRGHDRAAARARRHRVLPRGERAAAGRAPGHRAGDGRQPRPPAAAHRGRRAAAGEPRVAAAGPRGRGPAGGGGSRPRLPADGRHAAALRPADGCPRRRRLPRRIRGADDVRRPAREGDRPRCRPGRGVRPARGRARPDGRAGAADQPAAAAGPGRRSRGTRRPARHHAAGAHARAGREHGLARRGPRRRARFRPGAGASASAS